MIAEIQQCIKGFENELKNKFGTTIKLVVAHDCSDGVIEKIITVIAQVSEVSYDLIVSKKRGATEVSDARMVAMYFIKMNFPHFPYKKIGEHFGNRDHSTVINAVNVINTRLQVNDMPIKIMVADAAKKIEEIKNAKYDNNQ